MPFYLYFDAQLDIQYHVLSVNFKWYPEKGIFFGKECKARKQNNGKNTTKIKNKNCYCKASLENEIISNLIYIVFSRWFLGSFYK